MRWGLLAAGAFVCVAALFAALPQAAQLGVVDAVQRSVDTLSVAVRRMAGQRAEDAPGEAGSGRIVETDADSVAVRRMADERADGAGGEAGSGRSEQTGGDPVAARRMADERAEGTRDEAGSRRTVETDPDISGRAWVIDGDTIEIGTVRVRLHGIDAPESAQTCLAGGGRWPCGQHAARALAGQIGGRSVACDERDRDRYGRVVAVCRHGGRDVNAWLVDQGWALAYRRYSHAYVNEEAAAKAARRGLWRGEFVAPWDWRRGERLPSSRREAPRTAEAAPRTCTIKGNVSYNSGRRIYHIPGDRDYERTRISPSRGERWFCSEAEARAAGWRRAGR